MTNLVIAPMQHWSIWVNISHESFGINSMLYKKTHMLFIQMTQHRGVIWRLSLSSSVVHSHFNTLRPRQNGRHFTDDTFEHIFLNENVWISIEIPLKFVPKGPINNIPALVKIMTSHYVNQRWLDYRRIYASLCLNELNKLPFVMLLPFESQQSFASTELALECHLPIAP